MWMITTSLPDKREIRFYSRDFSTNVLKPYKFVLYRNGEPFAGGLSSDESNRPLEEYGVHFGCRKIIYCSRS